MEASMLLKVSRAACYTRSHSLLRCAFNGIYQSSGRAISSDTQPQTSDLRNIFRTSVDDPRQHTMDHEGLFYSISEAETNTLFKECIHPWYSRLMKTFNENCAMIRQPSLELNEYIKNINLNHPVQRFILYGRRGAGKKFSLNHTMHACFRNNFVIVHVPWAGIWARGWHKEITESTHKPGRYDLPTDGAKWLSHFLTQNEGRIKDLKITSEYIWTKREKATIGMPLEEIINFGLTRVKFSSDCVGVVLKELRQQAQTNGLKVFVSIEAVNAFFVQWKYQNALKNSEKKLIHPSEISLVHNFKKMLSPTWTHGVVVCTVEEEVNNLPDRKNYTPLYLLGKEGFEALDPFVPILVPEYSEKEALSNIDYFIERNWIQNEHGKTEEGKKEIMFVSNRNPFNLHRVCAGM